VVPRLCFPEARASVGFPYPMVFARLRLAARNLQCAGRFAAFLRGGPRFARLRLAAWPLRGLAAARNLHSMRCAAGVAESAGPARGLVEALDLDEARVRDRRHHHTG